MTRAHTTGTDKDKDKAKDKDAEMMAPRGKVRKIAGEEDEQQQRQALRGAPGTHAYTCTWCHAGFRTLRARCGHMGKCRQRRDDARTLRCCGERNARKLPKETYLRGKRGLRKERKLAARPARLLAKGSTMHTKGKMKLLLRHNVPVVRKSMIYEETEDARQFARLRNEVVGTRVQVHTHELSLNRNPKLWGRG